MTERVIVPVDPGLRKSGCSVYLDRVLHRAAKVVNTDKKSNGTTATRSMCFALKAWIDPVLQELYEAGIIPRPAPDLFLFEWPQMYDTLEKQKGDQNDLPALAGIDTGLACLYPGVPTKDYYPSDWKSQVDKAVMNDRVWRRLTPEEQAHVERLPKGGLSHDALDSAGLGLFYLGRLERVRVFVAE